MTSDILSPVQPVSVSRLRSLRLTVIVSFVVTFALCLLRMPAPKFLWDAAIYWSGTSALLGTGSTAHAGLLAIRGVLTPFVFVPAGLAANLGVPPNIAVLVQDSLLLAAIGCILLPALLSRMIEVTRRHVWVCAVATVVLLSGYAPYPLQDIWAVVPMLLGILLLSFKPRWVLLLAGLSLAVAGNLRPAYLIPVVVVMVIWAIRNWRRLGWPLVGIIAGFVPQVAFNWVSAHTLSLFPVLTGRISLIQFAYAGYVVRYDTIAYYTTGGPQQSFCSPDMAALIGSVPPSTTTQLLKLFLLHPIQSIPFAAEKVAANVAWDWATPYGQPAAEGFPWLGVISIAAVVGGLIALIVRTVRRRRTSSLAFMLFGLVAMTVVTIIGSTPETRFSVAIVLVAILGLAMLSSPRTFPVKSRLRAALVPGVIAVVLILGVTGLAIVGTSHPARPGNTLASDCALTR